MQKAGQYMCGCAYLQMIILEQQYNIITSIKIKQMHRLVGRAYRFSTILQILHRNKIELKSINRTQIAVRNENIQKWKSNKVKSLPFMNINYEYICQNYLSLSNQFSQLNPFADKLLPNQVLANGQQFEDYPLQKIINICLKYVQNGTNDQIIWDRLQKRITILMRDTSPVDNIILLYLSVDRWSKQLIKQIIANINAQLTLMNQQQHQFLFYTACQVMHKIKNNKNVEQVSKLNKIKEYLMNNVKKSKLNTSILIQWILLISITNAPSVSIYTTLKYFDKLYLHPNNRLSVYQFYALLVCLQSRATLAEQYELDLIRGRGRNLIQLFYSNSNSQSMIRGMKDKQQLRIKLILSYYSPQKIQNRLTNQQLLANILQPRQIIRYVYWLWKNNLISQYQLKTLYSTIQAQLDFQLPHPKQPFKYLDMVYYCSWVEMAVQDYIRYRHIIIICNSMEYIPKGLQWVVWNYLAQITKNKVELTSQQKQNIECIVKKIKNVDKQRQKWQRIQQQKKRIKNLAQIKQLSKFFHQIKLWNWNISQPIGSLDYIVHFINYQIKIIINCITYKDYCQPYSGNEINNQHLFNKRLLKQNFGFSLLDLHLADFMHMNYNDRIQWLRHNIGLLAPNPTASLQDK